MTKQEEDYYCVEKFNKMLRMLRKIAESYLTPDQLREESLTADGLDYDTAIEEAYKNIQWDASNCIKHHILIFKDKS